MRRRVKGMFGDAFSLMRTEGNPDTNRRLIPSSRFLDAFHMPSFANSEKSALC
jgi:hypothetical protein